MQNQRRSYKDVFRFHFGAVVLSLLFFISLSQPVLDFGNAQAAIMPWSPSSGSATDFDWQNGGSNKSLFGSPTIASGNIFHFEPKSFIAESSLGKSAITSDRLQEEGTWHYYGNSNDSDSRTSDYYDFINWLVDIYEKEKINISRWRKLTSCTYQEERRYAADSVMYV